MMNLCLEMEQSRNSLVKSTFTLLSDFRENLSIKMRSAEEMDQALILFSSLCAHHTSVHTTFYFSWILIDISSPSHHQADVELRETILKVGNNSKPTFGICPGLVFRRPLQDRPPCSKNIGDRPRPSHCWWVPIDLVLNRADFKIYNTWSKASCWRWSNTRLWLFLLLSSRKDLRRSFDSRELENLQIWSSPPASWRQGGRS